MRAAVPPEAYLSLTPEKEQHHNGDHVSTTAAFSVAYQQYTQHFPLAGTGWSLLPNR